MLLPPSSSSHRIDVREYDPTVEGSTGRKNISYLRLLDFLHHDLDHDTAPNPIVNESDDDVIEALPPVKAGSKRVRGGKVRGRVPKRPKVAEQINLDEDVAMARDDEPLAPSDKEHFLAFSHVFEMPCVGHRGRLVRAEWVDEENRFLQALTTRLGSAKEPGMVVFNEPISLRLKKTKRLIYAFRHNHHSTFSNALFALPSLIQDGFALEAHEFTDQNLSDVMLPVMELCNDGRALVDSRLRIQFSPTSPNSRPAELPYRLLLEVNVLLVSPQIFLPIDAVGSTISEAQRRLLHFLYPDHFNSPSPYKMDIPRFYSSLRPAPLISPQIQACIQPPGLTSTLLPFQRKSVQWMLEREGKTVHANGRIKPLEANEYRPVPLFWCQVPALQKSKAGKEAENFWWMNVLTGAISVEQPPDDYPITGGLLAEEPGLGKTVESIALVLYNTPSPADLGPSFYSAHIDVDVTPIKATLIVTPSTLFKQWTDELATHAPGLRVLLYEGWTSPGIKRIISRSAKPGAYDRARSIYDAADDDDYDDNGDLKRKRPKRRSRKPKKNTSGVEPLEGEENMDWIAFVGSHDVVLCTYNTLMNDLVVAKPPVRRPRREVATYLEVQEKFRSPLVLVEWQRVLMDEVQQVGGGQAAEMVSLIPRRSSFAVSGTPAKATVKDLIAPLRFLRLDFGARSWARLLEPAFYHSFVDIFDRYAIRTPKAEADGLDIPKQTRFVVPISLGMIERHFYEQTLETALLQLGLDPRGVAMFDDWELNAGLLRSAIRRLRMACIHPQVGNLGGNQGGGPKNFGAIRPIGDVLVTMVEQNWQAWVTDRRALINAKVTGALLEQKGKGSTRHKTSLDMFLAIRTEITLLLEELREALAVHDQKGKALIKAADERDAEMHHDDDSDSDNRPSASKPHSKGKGKGKEREREVDSDDPDFPNADLLPASAEGDEHRRGRMAFLARLREVQVVLHRVEFALGDLYHHFGKTKEEEEGYGQAETLRRALLKTTEKAANKSIKKLKREILEDGVKYAQLRINPARRPGIKSEALFAEANEILEVLEEQRVLLFKWREHIFGILTQKIVSEGENDGGEYQRALDAQGEAECYLAAYSALLADRREVLVEERTALAAHAEHERKLRHTKAAARAAAAFDDGGVNAVAAALRAAEMEDPALTKELKALRKECREAHAGNRALRSVMIDLGKVYGSDEEEKIAKDESLRLRRVIQEQTALVERMSNEQAPFRTTFNGRIAYFRQLQEISDSVAEIDMKDATLAQALEENTVAINTLQDHVRIKGARQRYLQYIAKKAEDMDEEDKECGICNCDFETGSLLACGHIFCDDCLETWRKKGHSRCSTCREHIDDGSIHGIKFSRSAEDQVEQLRKEEAEAEGEGDLQTSLKTIKFKTIPAETLQELSKVESFGQQGAKIQTLIRHLLLIEQTDPGSKSIVFSAWADSLNIIEHGLNENGIACVQINNMRHKNNAAHQFQNDPSIRVMLLHGERENSGLNLTCAKRIMLVEPTVNSSFEIQAIARVDRLGQKEETEVYCYYATDTVEQNILENAARKGTSLYTVGNAETAVNLAAAAVVEKQVVEGGKQKAALKGDFIAGSRQMLEVLFPSLFVEIEDLVMEDVMNQETEVVERNPRAGPSRA